MRTLIFFTVILSMPFVGICSNRSVCNANRKPQIKFTENKGQVCNQHQQQRPDVLFYGSAGTMNFYLKRNGISYQLNKVKKLKQSSHSQNAIRQDLLPGAKQRPDLNQELIVQRIDIEWLNANENAELVTDDAIRGLDNFYGRVGPDGITGVKSFKDITYKNIYGGIDLHYYSKRSAIKYDYIVKPNADYKQIIFKVSGATRIEIKSDGRLLIKTPLGSITEDAPLVMQGNKKLDARWILSENNCLSFEIDGHDPNKSMVIDPLVRLFGSYLGGNWDEYIYANATDANRNYFVAGLTNSQVLIATVGAFQTLFGSPGNFQWNKDAFLVKFDSNGVRQWGTYYGDSDYQEATGCATDKLNNVYMCGYNNGPSGSTLLATPGAFLPTSSLGFLAKFSNAGLRIWSTYYYGPCGPCATDASNNIYIAGKAQGQFSVGVFATANAHQTTFNGWYDAFVAKFTPGGQRIWSTYYGGPYEDYANGLATDQNRNVILSGFTNSGGGGTTIATPGSYQPAGNGNTNYDAYLVKFDSMGVRQWGTYYGGAAFEMGYGTTTDPAGNIYLVGTTDGATTFSSVNCHQPTAAGLYDGFIAKFSPAGARLWGTFYGGNDQDFVDDCMTDAYSNVFVVGGSMSTNQIATPGSYQVNNNGYWDAFMAKFNSAGVRQWGTYYGGTDWDKGLAGLLDRSMNPYMAGFSYGTTNIASPGSHQDTLGGAIDGFFVKFADCYTPAPPIDITPPNNLVVCANTSATLLVNYLAATKWYATANSTLVLGTGSVFVTPTLSAGTYTFFSEANSCTPNLNRTPITITVAAGPTLSLAGPDSICAGSPANFNASGAQQYQWSTGGTGSVTVLTPSTSLTFTLTGTVGNCATSIVKTVTIKNLVQITITGNSVVCSGSTLQLTAASNSIAAVSYMWSTGFNLNVITVSPTLQSVYSVTVTGTNGCLGTASKTVSVDPLPLLSLSSPSTIICAGESVTLSATGGPTINWSNGVTGFNNPVNPALTTIYTATAINAQGCLFVQSITQSVTSCAGIGEENFSFIEILPNPASSHVTIKLNGIKETGSVKVYNSIGQLVHTTMIHSNTTEIELYTWAAGIYLVEVHTAGVGVMLRKLVKQ